MPFTLLPPGQENSTESTLENLRALPKVLGCYNRAHSL